MKLLTNFTLNFDKLPSYPTEAISFFDLNDYSITIHYSSLEFDKFIGFSLKNFYTNQVVDFRLYDWKGLGFVIENKTLFVNNQEDIRKLFSILASTYNNISVAGYTLSIYCTNTINAKVSSKVKFVRVNLCPAGNVAMNSACDFGVVLTKGYDEPKFKSFYTIVNTYYKQVGKLPETMFIYNYKNETYYFINWDKSLLTYIAKMHFLEK